MQKIKTAMKFKYLSVIVFAFIGMVLSFVMFDFSLKAVQSLLCLLEFAYFSYEDIKDMAVTTAYAIASIMLNILFVFLFHGLDGLKASAISLITVAVLTSVITVLSKQQLGWGDVMILSSASVLIGWQAVLLLTAFAVMLLLGYFVFSYFRHNKKSISLPFVAFMLPAYSSILLFM